MKSIFVSKNTNDFQTHGGTLRLLRNAALKTGALALLLVLNLFADTGCDTPQGASALSETVSTGAGVLAGALIGRGHNTAQSAAVGGAIGYAVGHLLANTSVFKSRKLNFQEAVMNGDVSKARHYVDARNIDEPIKNYPPVYYAAVRGDTGMLEMLASNGATIHRHFNGRSLAYNAAVYGHVDTAEEAVSLGAGTMQDVRQGGSVYAANEREQQQMEREGCAVAITFLAAAIQDEMRPHYYEDDYGNIYNDAGEQVY
jgi:hypothetical protein